ALRRAVYQDLGRIPHLGHLLYRQVGPAAELAFDRTVQRLFGSGPEILPRQHRHRRPVRGRDLPGVERLDRGAGLLGVPHGPAQRAQRGLGAVDADDHPFRCCFRHCRLLQVVPCSCRSAGPEPTHFAIVRRRPVISSGSMAMTVSSGLSTHDRTCGPSRSARCSSVTSVAVPVTSVLQPSLLWGSMSSAWYATARPGCPITAVANAVVCRVCTRIRSSTTTWLRGLMVGPVSERKATLPNSARSSRPRAIFGPSWIGTRLFSTFVPPGASVHVMGPRLHGSKVLNAGPGIDATRRGYPRSKRFLPPFGACSSE